MSRKNKSISKIKAKRIRLLILDVDGVLTAGHIVIDGMGPELKVFNVHDGLGLALWRRAGFKTAIITAGNTKAVRKRSNWLKIDKVCQGIIDKLPAYEKMKRYFGMEDDQVCFVGDDLTDLPVLKTAGISCTVPGAPDYVKSRVDYISKNQGGRGAVREVIEVLLKAKGVWHKTTKKYF
jgi:3-deoxy-D-manno-octulosonate 8-phosphate phosphatase (KDO 8-P phosphatase)